MHRPYVLPTQLDIDPKNARILEDRFDYTPLAAEVAQRVQKAANRIRVLAQRTLKHVVAVGKELLRVKKELPHGQFSTWLRAEFDWTERTARRFMAVAQCFRNSTDQMSVLQVDRTAAYLLAAPSVPRQASEIALQRARNGERITLSVARGILHTLANKPLPRVNTPSALSDTKLLGQLLESLESFRQRWDPRRVEVLARQLRDFADSLGNSSACSNGDTGPRSR